MPHHHDSCVCEVVSNLLVIVATPTWRTRVEIHGIRKSTKMRQVPDRKYEAGGFFWDDFGPLTIGWILSGISPNMPICQRSFVTFWPRNYDLSMAVHKLQAPKVGIHEPKRWWNVSLFSWNYDPWEGMNPAGPVATAISTVLSWWWSMNH